jgi:hypothetical protein
MRFYPDWAVARSIVCPPSLLAVIDLFGAMPVVPTIDFFNFHIH